MDCRLTCISLRSGEAIPVQRSTVLCLGNFDGVHIAHRTLLSSAVAWQKERFPNAVAGVFCFRELPAFVLEKTFSGALCDLEERLERFRACGMEFAVLADFSDLRDLSAEAYIQTVLKGQCNAVAVACGYNHRFGKGGSGDISMLRRDFGERLFVQDAVELDGAPVSSSRIRKLLQTGEAESASKLLTRPYEITAPVLHGKALGSRMGTPTVNQKFPQGAVVPKRGVYVTECAVDGIVYRGVTNVGVRPTVESDGEVNFETYLLDFSGDLYGKTLTVKFLKYLREERKFEDADALWRQISADVEAARAC